MDAKIEKFTVAYRTTHADGSEEVVVPVGSVSVPPPPPPKPEPEPLAFQEYAYAESYQDLELAVYKARKAGRDPDPPENTSEEEAA